MDRNDLEWMRLHPLYINHHVNSAGGYSVWVCEELGGKLHPWPFSNISDFKQWVKHK